MPCLSDDELTSIHDQPALRDRRRTTGTGVSSTTTLLAILVCVLASALLTSCASGPSEEERAQLKIDLFKAIEAGNVAKVAALLESGADANSWWDGHSMLMWATIYAHYDVAEILLEAGADVNAAHSVNHTVLFHAVKAPDIRPDFLLPLLLSYGVRMEYSPLTTVSRFTPDEHVEESLQILIRAGAELDAVRGSETALMAAADRGHEGAVRLLIAEGADVNFSTGRTALTLARTRPNIRPWKTIAEMLIEAGAEDQES